MTGAVPVLTGPGPGPAVPGAAVPVTSGPASPGGPGPGPAAVPPRGALRRWRAPLTVLALVLLGGIVVALLRPSPPTTGYLDPGNPGSQGTRALAALLAQRGQPVIRADSVAAALAEARGGSPGPDSGPDSGPARAAGAGRTPALVITSPYRLSPRQLGELARQPGNLMVVEPDSAVLAALNGQPPQAPGRTRPPGRPRPSSRTAVPRVSVAGADEVRPVRPGCTLAAATAAGDAAMGGVLMRVRDSATGAGSGTGAGQRHGRRHGDRRGRRHGGRRDGGAGDAGAAQCYPVDGHPSLVRYLAGGRTVTLLGSGLPLTDGALAQRGNAALALNLLRGSPRIVWLVPSPPAVTTAGQKSLFQEIPGPAYLVAVQLFVAAGLAALWRTRRLGPLVSEPLPVLVRASETVEGHGRLYRSRRSRGRAAEVLRDAARHRITARLALPGGADAGAVSAAVAALTGREPGAVRVILYGPAPRDDAALVALGQDIDALEGEVRTQ